MWRHVVRQLLLPLRLQHQRAPAYMALLALEALDCCCCGDGIGHAAVSMGSDRGQTVERKKEMILLKNSLLKRHNIAYDERYLWE